MESWSYDFGGKDFVSDDSASANGGISRSSSKNGLMGCELKSPWSIMVCSSQEGVVNQDYADLGSSDMMRIGDILSPPNAFSGQNESSSKLSSSIVESSCRDSSLIDLKLGRLNDYRDSNNFSYSKAESSIPLKRARGGGFGSQIPCCQVYGCKKDLSSSKDYHKRHKVCEIHSKTAKVIVNGIEQRFCQQCSRFHLLSEFDDGKRSCRKRLAGHNERRRKPHMRIHADRSGRLFHSFNATRFQGNTSYEIHDSSRIVKIEDGVDLSSRFSNPFTIRLVQPKSISDSHDSRKQSPSLHDDDGISVITRSKINENSLYLQDVADSGSMSRSIFHYSSVGNEDMRLSDSSSTIQSHSHRVLSLLSSRVPTALPLISSGSRALYTLAPEKLFGVDSTSSTFNSSLMNSVEENHLNPILISDSSAAVNNGIIQESEYMNRKNSVSFEENPTINLLADAACGASKAIHANEAGK